MKNKILFMFICFLAFVSVSQAQSYYFSFNSSDTVNYTCEVEDQCIPVGSFLIGSYLYTPEGNAYYPVVDDSDILLATKSIDNMDYFDMYYKDDEQMWYGMYATGKYGDDMREKPIDDVDEVCITHVNGSLYKPDAYCASSDADFSATFISYNTAGEAHSESVHFVEGESISSPIPVSKDGYAFKCWSRDESSSNYTCANSFPQVVDNGSIFYAKYEAIDYVVKYNLNGGRKNGSTTIADSTCNISLAIAAYSFNENICKFTSSDGITKTGYDFVGWSTSQNYNSSRDPLYLGDADIITSLGNNHNVTLYAVWTPKIYTISYNYNGGVASNVGTFTYSESSQDILLNPPTKDNYHFTGWNSDSINGYTINGNTITIAARRAQNISVSADFEINQVTIKYKEENNNINEIIYNCDYTNNGCNISSRPPTNATIAYGHVFAGWDIYSSDDSKVLSVVGGASINPHDLQPGEYEAKIRTNYKEYNVHYVCKVSGVVTPCVTGSNTTHFSYNDYNTTSNFIQLNYTDPVKDGYHVSSRSADGNNEFTYQGDNYYLELANSFTGTDITITVNLVPNQYQVHYLDYNGNAIEGYSTPCTYDTACSVGYTLPAREGMISVGWLVNGVIYPEDGSFMNLTANDGSIVNATAFYENPNENYITINYHVESGDLISENALRRIPASSNLSYDLPNASREGNDFKGWMLSQDGTSTVDSVTVQNAQDGVIDLYPSFDAKSINVVYHEVNDTGTHNCTYGVGCTIGLSTEPTKPGYLFVGWSTYSDENNRPLMIGNNVNFGTKLSLEGLTSSGTLDLYPVWVERVSYNVNYSTEAEGTPVYVMTCYYDSSCDISNIDHGTVENKRFIGFVYSDGTEIEGTDILVTDHTVTDVYLHGKWTNVYLVRVRGTGYEGSQGYGETFECTYGTDCNLPEDRLTDITYSDENIYRPINFVDSDNLVYSFPINVTDTTIETLDLTVNDKTNEYTVYIDYSFQSPYGRTVSSYNEEFICIYGENCVMNQNVPTDNRYHVSGYTSTNPTGVTFSNPFTYSNVLYDRVSFQATWEQ